MIYPLLDSCRRRGLSLFNYLKSLFICLPAAKITQIKEFYASGLGPRQKRNSLWLFRQLDKNGSLSNLDSGFQPIVQIGMLSISRVMLLGIALFC